MRVALPENRQQSQPSERKICPLNGIFLQMCRLSVKRDWNKKESRTMRKIGAVHIQNAQARAGKEAPVWVPESY